MATLFFKQNGSLITAVESGTLVTLNPNGGGTHTLSLSTELLGIGTNNAGTMPNDNTIYIDAAVAKANLRADGPEVYFTAIDETEIYLNIKIRVTATKTNHASAMLVGV